MLKPAGQTLSMKWFVSVNFNQSWPPPNSGDSPAIQIQGARLCRFSVNRMGQFWLRKKTGGLGGSSPVWQQVRKALQISVIVEGCMAFLTFHCLFCYCEAVGKSFPNTFSTTRLFFSIVRPRWSPSSSFSLKALRSPSLGLSFPSDLHRGTGGQPQVVTGIGKDGLSS